MHLLRRIGGVAAIALLAACSGGASGSPAPSSAAKSVPSASASASPTSTPRPTPLTVGGSRPAVVRMPSGGSSGPAPLVLLLHGFTSSPGELESYFRLNRSAGEHGIVIVLPEGGKDRDLNRFWNATDACCNFYGSEVDDVAYLAGLIDEVSKLTQIDPKRVYVVGHSNGGFMSYRMSCDRADLIAAMVSLAGATFADDADCKPSGPVTVLQIHGSADDTILYQGGTVDFGGSAPAKAYPGAKSTVSTWATYNGCTTTFEKRADLLNIDVGIAGPSGPPETITEAAKGCPQGGAVELWTIPGGGHVPSLSDEFGSYVVDFLLAHPKP